MSEQERTKSILDKEDGLVAGYTYKAINISGIFQSKNVCIKNTISIV